eukprot:SAG22_NODE_18353_length_288_cov_1.899471_1_plen_80_part_01
MDYIRTKLPRGASCVQPYMYFGNAVCTLFLLKGAAATYEKPRFTYPGRWLDFVMRQIGGPQRLKRCRFRRFPVVKAGNWA